MKKISKKSREALALWEDTHYDKLSDCYNAYKIVEVVDGAVRTLFHGLEGSRTMPEGVWLRADEKFVRDGSSTWYLSGWHVLLSRHEACCI